MTLLHRIAVALTAAYGLIALVGGLIGYLKAGSIASLIAGGGSGLLLLVCAALGRRQKPTAGLIGAMVVSFLLVARFLNAAITQGALAPVSAVMIVGGAAVLIATGLALKERR